MRDKQMNDPKHKVERALRRAKEQKGLDYIEWTITDEDILDYVMRHYEVELLRYEVKRGYRRGLSNRSSKSNLIKAIYRKKNPISYLELTPQEVAECRRAGLEVTPRVYRIRRLKKENCATDRGRRDGRRNIGKNLGCKR